MDMVKSRYKNLTKNEQDNDILTTLPDFLRYFCYY